MREGEAVRIISPRKYTIGSTEDMKWSKFKLAKQQL